MKKTRYLAAMVVIAALSAAAFAGCGDKEARPPEIIKDDTRQQSGDTQLKENQASSGQESDNPHPEAETNGQDIAYYQEESPSMTFEEFMIGIKEDLAPEVMEELREIYEEWLEAEEEGDSDKIIELYETLQDMGVLTMEKQAPMYTVKTKP